VDQNKEQGKQAGTPAGQPEGNNPITVPETPDAAITDLSPTKGEVDVRHASTRPRREEAGVMELGSRPASHD